MFKDPMQLNYNGLVPLQFLYLCNGDVSVCIIRGGEAGRMHV